MTEATKNGSAACREKAAINTVHAHTLAAEKGKFRAKRCSLENRPSPSSMPMLCMCNNYAWNFYQREKAWTILASDAWNDLRGMTFTSTLS